MTTCQLIGIEIHFARKGFKPAGHWRVVLSGCELNFTGVGIYLPGEDAAASTNNGLNKSINKAQTLMLEKNLFMEVFSLVHRGLAIY